MESNLKLSDPRNKSDNLCSNLPMTATPGEQGYDIEPHVSAEPRKLLEF